MQLNYASKCYGRVPNTRLISCWIELQVHLNALPFSSVYFLFQSQICVCELCCYLFSPNIYNSSQRYANADSVLVYVTETWYLVAVIGDDTCCPFVMAK